MGILRAVKVLLLIDVLDRRDYLDKEDLSAMLLYYFAGNHPYFLKRFYESMNPKKEEERKAKRGVVKLICQQGYMKDIEKKLNEHIIPVAERSSICYLWKKRNKLTNYSLSSPAKNPEDS